MINTTVLVETLNRYNYSDDIRDCYDELIYQNIVVSLNRNDYLESIKINRWYSNSINYSDCTIIKTMMDKDIQRIVSFDSDFEKVGKYEVISRGRFMIFNFKCPNKRVEMLLEKKAEELHISIDRLIWNYINRGIMEDNFTVLFDEVHSKDYLQEVNEALGLLD